MSLDLVLTTTRLRALAGYGYARGERYWKQGRVLSCHLEGDRLDGVVAGSNDYRVRILAHARSLVSECTCPVGQRGELCKHAVALALCHLEGAPARRAPVHEDPAFATRDELDAWVAAHQVTHELGVAADTVLPDLAELHNRAIRMAYMIGRLTLRELGSLDGVRRHLEGWELQREVAVAVRRRFERAAETVRDGLAAEAVTRSPPTHPTLARLWTKLVELRRTVRRHAVPRANTGGVLLFDSATATLQWHEPVKLARDPLTFTQVPVIATLRSVPALELACACKLAACAHGLSLIDAAFDLMLDRDRHAEVVMIAEELLRPAWQRALAELSIEPKPPSEIEVWWRVELVMRTFTVTPLVKRRLKTGKLSAGTRIPADRLLYEHHGALSEQDTRIAEHLASWSEDRRSTYPARAFAALVGHPRVLTDDGDPIAIERVQLGFTALQAGDQIRLEPAVGGARFSPRLLAPLLQAFRPGEPLIVVEPEHRRCRLIEVGDDARRMWHVLAKHGDTFPPESHTALLDRLAALDARMPIAVPPELMGDRLTEAPIIVARLRLSPEATLELEPFVRVAPGAPIYPPSVGPRDVMIVRDGRRGYVRRDLEREHELVRSLLARLPLESAEEGPPLCFGLADPDAALAVVAAVQQPPPGLEAEWVDDAPTIVSSGGPASLRVQIDHDRDWFGISGQLEVDHGKLELAVLLDAARRQQRFVRIDANRWLELTSALQQRLVALSDQTFVTRDHLELSSGAVPVLRELSDAGVHVETPPLWKLMTERLAAAAKLRPKPPATLRATLRPYQIEGHAWLSRLAAWGAGACLADDMGLGKTVQAIAVLLDRAKLGPAIVLAPTSVSLNWVDELRRFAPGLRPVLYSEVADRDACLATLGKKDVLIVSYGLLVRDAAALAKRTFGTLVVDEAQAVKNPRTHRARAARGLDAAFRFALSGTPLENHLGELWSLFSIVFPGLLGSWEQFRTRFAVPIERDRDSSAREALSRLLRPFLLRRTKQEVAPELPSRTEIEVPVALSTEELELYDTARLAAIAHLDGSKSRVRDERHRFQVLAALTRLRLLASHPKLYDAESSVASSKMQRLRELLDELREAGHRTLVFSQFTSHLALVRDELDRGGFESLYLDGATPAATRAELIRRFQSGEAEVFLISLKAGGTGINLTAADYVIHLDPWWNPAVEDQATDRAHRIGQTKPVTVYRLIARGTVEEKILAMHSDKRALVAGVLEGTDVAARLTTGDLLALLGEQRASL